VIIQRTLAIIAKTGDNVAKFASRVADGYMSSVGRDDRTIDFVVASSSSIEALTTAESRNREKIDHILRGVTRFPADLEEAWINALPDPDRSDLVRALAQRYGLIGAKLPDLQPHIARLSDVLTDAGRTAQLLAPMFSKGTLDVQSENGQRVVASLVQMNRGIADLISLQEQIKAMLPKAAKSPAKRRK
jgi:hypothetical protein